MKKLLLALLVFSFLSSITQAKEVYGEIIFKDGYSQKVTFDIPLTSLSRQPDLSILQHKVKYFNTDGKKEKVSPTEALEVRFHYKGEEIRLISCVLAPSPVTPQNLEIAFLKLKKEGPVSLFHFTENSLDYHALSTSEGTVDVFRNGKCFIKKDLIKHFQDHPDIIQKIESDNFNARKDICALIDYFNLNN